MTINAIIDNLHTNDLVSKNYYELRAAFTDDADEA